MRPSARRSALLATVIAVVVGVGAAGWSQAASSAVVVSMTVPSMTSISLTGCPSSARSFGTVLPDTPTVTASDCSVQFSGGTTSRLRVRQSDGSGSAMFTRTTGTGDASWGVGGVRDMGGGAGSDWLAGTAVTSTGHVLRGGNRGSDFIVARLTPAGALDTPAYGGDGYANADPTGAGEFTHTHAIDVFSDDSVVIAGHADFGGAGDEPTFVKFTSSGVRDMTWGDGDDGITHFDVAAGSGEEPYDVHVLPDGSVLTGGYSYGNRVWIARLDPDGILDPTFGGGDGIADFATGATTRDGRLTIDGPTQDIYWTGTVSSQAYVAKFDRSGARVTTWGVGGVRQVNVAGMPSDELGPGFIDSAGRLVVTGDGDGSFVFLLRLDAAGAPDATFGPGGIVVHDLFGARESYLDGGMLIERGGDRFCTSGNGEPVTSGSWRLYAACFTGTGAPDPTFGGGDGIAEFNATDVQSYEGGMAEHDGRIYMGGGENNRLVTVRMGSDTSTIPDYVHPGTSFASTGGAFGACLRSSSNATTTWTPGPAGSCTGDGAHWNGIVRTTASAATEIATATSGLVAQVDLRFGIRAAGAARGSFEAPITFEVVAP